MTDAMGLAVGKSRSFGYLSRSGGGKNSPVRANLPAPPPPGGGVAIGFGIIGTGKHGARYLKHMVDVPALRLVAIARRDRDAGEAQARAAGCRFHTEAEALIADPEVEAMALVVPPTLNESLAVAAARAGKALL